MKSFKEFLTQIKEEQESEVHHASVIPLVGYSPISHGGHAIDMGSALAKLPGQKHVGMSSKADVYSPEERSEIMKRQWQIPGIQTHSTNSGGDTIGRAFHNLPKTGKKVLHLLVGHDRVGFAEGLKKSLEAGKIKEMDGHSWDEIHIHTPEDTNRSHGMSGTKMRTAVANNDFDEFHRHLGSMFSKDEAKQHFNRIKAALDSGQLKVKR